MKKNLLYFLIFPAIFFTCAKDSGDRLFEMYFLDTRFNIQAGWSASVPRAFELNGVQSGIATYLADNNLSLENVTAIRPLTARITSLEGGLDYDFVREISIRVCPDGSAACTPADEVFYIDNLENRGRTVVDLLPTLRNVKTDLGSEKFKLEIVFFFAYITPYSLESRLDMTFEAVE
jgi:hypothetical protein